MSFVGKAVVGLGQTLGIFPKAPSAPAMMAPPPSYSNSANQASMDDAAKQWSTAVQGGKTSTQLTGGGGEDESKLNTSKVLLGQ